MQVTDNTLVSAPVFITVQRFCQERSLPRSTFYKLVKARQIRPVKRGRRTLIRACEAERYDNSLPLMAA